MEAQHYCVSALEDQALCWHRLLQMCFMARCRRVRRTVEKVCAILLAPMQDQASAGHGKFCAGQNRGKVWVREW